jgi:hypothetical protein
MATKIDKLKDLDYDEIVALAVIEKDEDLNEIFTDENTLFINYLDPLLGIRLPIENIIISKKDIESNFLKPIDYVIFGKNGFIGSHIIKYLDEKNSKYICCNLRLEKIQEIETFIVDNQDRLATKAA